MFDDHYVVCTLIGLVCLVVTFKIILLVSNVVDKVDNILDRVISLVRISHEVETRPDLIASFEKESEA